MGASGGARKDLSLNDQKTTGNPMKRQVHAMRKIAWTIVKPNKHAQKALAESIGHRKRLLQPGVCRQMDVQVNDTLDGKVGAFRCRVACSKAYASLISIPSA